jgi:ribonuclease HII
MPLVVGIDEAGYGPLLGPLVVGATVWQVEGPAEGVPAGPPPRGRRPADDFWKRLRPAVCRHTTRHDGRLPVNDSKQVFDQKRGIATLERTVLAFAANAGGNCATVADFLASLGVTDAELAAAAPWYRELGEPLPVDPVRSGYLAAATRLKRAMETGGVRCCGLLAQVVTEDFYNERVRQTRNKHEVLLEQVLRLMQRGTCRCADQEVHVHVDRLGGRQDYQPVLLQAYPGRHLHIEHCEEAYSRYRLGGPPADWFLDFTVDGDQYFMPIALASMVAKYVRELLMRQFNAYWRKWLPELRPTAGYFADARRFIADIRPVLAASGLAAQQVIRRC